MRRIQVLDCTLREAPVQGLIFGTDFIRKFINGLERSGTDIIEVGFLKDEEHVEGSTIFNTVEQIVPYLNKKSGSSKYVALIDYGRFDIDSLENNQGNSIDAIRICFKKGEQWKALNLAQQIMDKGYQVCIQHVDTQGYKKSEIEQFLVEINKLKPYAYSVVDTFGAMYQKDAKELFELVDDKLDDQITLGFHAHNNLMLADANSQFFTQCVLNRKLIVDGSVGGCGRGAGNSHTELQMAFLNENERADYQLDDMLDLMDDCLPILKSSAKQWGYSVPYFIAGMYGAHVFNVDYLQSRHNIKSKDMREIIQKLDENEKRKYDYQLLENLYIEHFDNEYNDEESRIYLRKLIANRKVLLLAPGQTVISEKEKVQQYIDTNNPLIIHVNNVIPGYLCDLVFFSSPKRYNEGIDKLDAGQEIVVTSNISVEGGDKAHIFDYKSLIKRGWINIDNAFVLLMRLLLQLGTDDIALAGFDGYSQNDVKNFYYGKIDKMRDAEQNRKLNMEIIDMLKDLKNDFVQLSPQIKFLTTSLYDGHIN